MAKASLPRRSIFACVTVHSDPDLQKLAAKACPTYVCIH